LRPTALLFCIILPFAAPAAADKHEAFDLTGKPFAVPDVTVDTCEAELVFENLLPAGNDDGRNLNVWLKRFAGEHRLGHGRAPKYNHSQHGVEPGDAKWSGDAVKGTMHFRIIPDRWVPNDGKIRLIECQVDLKVGELHKDDDNPAAQFREVSGTYAAVIRHPEAAEDPIERSGKVSGRIVPTDPVGHWNQGETDKSGTRFTFDMGSQRTNWNKFKAAVMELPKVSDLSHTGELHVKVATDKPRNDVNVTLWAREQDGSWYYLRSALPLIDKTNEAVLYWDDFQEAEWVCPGSHMDEDYVLDLTKISHIAVGVVNPFGVGEVAFTLQSLVARPGGPTFDAPAKVHVTGKTVSVNGHDVIPAGVFGGYAPYLPQRFRPGTQRNLYAPSYPIIPRQRFAQISGHEVPDWPSLMDHVQGKHEATRAIADHLESLAGDGKSLKRLQRFNREKYVASQKKRDRNPDDAPGDLTNYLNSLLRNRDLYDPKLFIESKLPAPYDEHVKNIDELNDTQLVELNRRLLEAAFPGQIELMSPHGPTEQYYINCFGERKNRAHLLYRPDWQEMFESYGKTLALNAKKAGYNAHWEFWNEPYLHWGEKDRINLKTELFDVSQAKEDGPVQVKYKNGEPGPVIPHFRWRKNAKGDWEVYDESAFTFWSGSGNGWIYDQMFHAAASSIKKHNPNVKIIAGWGFRWHEDHWGAWDVLYKNTIDRGIDYIHGIHEHHYQGDTTAMLGSYEVLACYGMTKHGKWLYSYNTETNDLIDAPARGAVASPEAARRASEYRRMVYNFRDILYAVAEAPDKHYARTMIHWDHFKPSSEAVFNLLVNLRGRLIAGNSSDDKVWVVSSIDGTDPNAMPPGFDGTQEHVTVLFNDHREPREVELTIDAPTGTTFTDGYVEHSFVDLDTFEIGLKRNDVDAKGRKQMTFKVTLPGRGAWKASFKLNKPITDKTQVTRKQYFAADILKHAERGKPLATSIAIDADALKSADRAWLRVVVEEVATGEATVLVGEQAVDIPRAYTQDNGMRLFNLPLDPRKLAASNDVVFKVNDGNYSDYRVCMASIVLEHRDEQ